MWSGTDTEEDCDSVNGRTFESRGGVVNWEKSLIVHWGFTSRFFGRFWRRECGGVWDGGPKTDLIVIYFVNTKLFLLTKWKSHKIVYRYVCLAISKYGC